MTGGSWLCLLAPLVATILILLGGSRLPRAFAAWTATTSVFVAFAGAIWAFVGVHRAADRDPGAGSDLHGRSDARRDHDGVDVAVSGPLQRRPAAARRPAEHDDDAHRLRRRRADRPLLDRLHGRRRRGAPLLRLHRVLRLLDADARRGREPADAAHRLGARRPLLLPTDRLLARAAERGARGEEGVHHERVRRRDDGARLLHPHRAHELAVVRKLSTRISRRRRRISSRSACSAARWRSRRRSRSRRGCPTRWKAPRRSAPSSTRRRWSPPAST